MKRSTRLLSVLLAFLLVFNIIMPSAKAATTTGSTSNILDDNITNAALKIVQKLVNSVLPGTINDNSIKDFDTLLNKNNLSDMVGRLLKSLNDRKQKLLPSLLPIVATLMYEEFTGEKEAPELSSEEAAKVILDYVDAMLAEEGEHIKEQIGTIKVELDLRSIDGALSSVYSTITNNRALLLLLGDLNKLNVTAFKNVQRKGGDMKVIYALIQFLKDNESIIKKLAKGDKLSLGAADTFIKEEIRFDIPAMLLDLIYDELIKEKDGPKRADSAYKSYNADALLNVALQDMLKKEFDFFDDALLAKADINKLSVYSLLENFVGVFFENLAVEPLNKDFKKSLANLSGAKYNKDNGSVTKGTDTNKFYDVINWDYKFTKDSYNFSLGYIKHGGIVEQVNDIVYTIFETVLTKEAFASIGLVSGSNNNLNANIEKLVRFILPLTPAEFFHDGFDPAKLSEKDIAAMSFEQIAALAFRAVIESSPDIAKSLLSLIETFGIPIDNIVIPDEINFFPEDVEINTLEKLAAYTMRGLANEILSKDFINLYDKTIKTANDKALVDLSLDIFMDILIHFANDFLPLNLGADEVLKLKTEKAWKAEHFLDEIIDWILEYTSGIFAVSDKFPAASVKRGELDANYGPWTKINMFANSLFPLDFINGKAFNKDGVSGLDLEDLVKDKLLGDIFDLEIERMLYLIKPSKFKTEGSLKAINPIKVSAGASTDLRIVSTISQANASELINLPSNNVASGAIDEKVIVEVGTLITTKAYAISKGWNTLDINTPDSKVKQLKSNQIYTDNAKADGSGYYYFAAKIKGIKKSHTDEIFAVGYIKYISNGKTEVVYTRGQTYVLADFA